MFIKDFQVHVRCCYSAQTYFTYEPNTQPRTNKPPVCRTLQFIARRSNPGHGLFGCNLKLEVWPKQVDDLLIKHRHFPRLCTSCSVIFRREMTGVFVWNYPNTHPVRTCILLWNFPLNVGNHWQPEDRLLYPIPREHRYHTGYFLNSSQDLWYPRVHMSTLL